MEADIQEIKLTLKQNKVEYVKVAISDLDGVLRGKYMHVDKFLKSIESGYGFCDVIFGWDSSDELYEFKISDDQNLFTGWHTGFPDQTVKIILDSKRTIPFEKNTPFFLSELNDGVVMCGPGGMYTTAKYLPIAKPRSTAITSIQKIVL